MATTSFAAEFNDVPEIRVLATCAARCRIRFWLKNPVAELYLRYPSWQGRPVSLYNFVAPFEHLNLLFEAEDEGARLDRAIAVSLPLADYHRWASIPFPGASANVFVPADSLTLEFDGRTGTDATVELRASEMTDAATHDYVRPVYSSNIRPDWRIPNYYPDLLLTALSTARYWFAYPPEESPVDEALIAAIGERLREVERDSVAAHLIDPHFVRAVEAIVLSLLFSALNFEDALSWLRDARGGFAPGLVEASVVLSEVLFKPEVSGATLIGAVQCGYPSRSSLLLEHQTESVGGPASLIPWTPIRLEESKKAEGGGRYGGIRTPAATVSWRPRKGPAFPDVWLPDLAVAARSRSEASPEPWVRAVPGILFRGPSLTARIDHEYALATADGNALLEYGVVAAPSEPAR